mgnify:CR=1 FL=1
MAEGAEVVLLDVQCGQRRCRDLACDVRDPGAVAAAITPRRRGCSTAPPTCSSIPPGYTAIAPLLDLTPGEWDDVVAVNLRGTFLAGRAVAAALDRGGRPGAIVNISSTAGLVADAVGAERPLQRGARRACWR